MGLDDSELNEEPTAAEIADACKDVLDRATCEEIAAMDDEEAIGLVFTALIEAGVDDPEEFLKAKGILLPSEDSNEDE